MPATLCGTLVLPFFIPESRGVIEEDALRILAAEPSSRNQKTVEGFSPVHLAALNGYNSVLMKLKQLNVSLATPHTGNYLTPVLMAAIGGRKSTLEYLNSQGIDLKVEDSDTNNATDLAIGAYLADNTVGSDALVYLLKQGILPSSKTTPEQIVELCNCLCIKDDELALRTVVDMGIEIPYVISKTTGFHLLVNTSILSMSTNCLRYLHDELRLPLSSSDVRESEDSYDKVNPLALIMQFLPVNGAFSAPQVFLSTFRLGCDSALSMDVQAKAYECAKTIFEDLNISPNSRLRYDYDAEQFYIESVYMGSVKLLFGVDGVCTNQDALITALLTMITTLKAQGFSYINSSGIRVGEYDNLFRTPVEILTIIVDDGFPLKIADLENSLGFCDLAVALYLMENLSNDMSEDEKNVISQQIDATNNTNLVGHEGRMKSALDSAYTRSHTTTIIPRRGGSGLVPDDVNNSTASAGVPRDEDDLTAHVVADDNGTTNRLRV
ncbi:MAG: hypothetical protein HOI53_04035 [Francisellaceae bacterium]|nr:hypothetical protein [Francisellaceae bacterium]MBT6207173.1 hypothetical protein [Francisellaceae bacterium]